MMGGQEGHASTYSQGLRSLRIPLQTLHFSIGGQGEREVAFPRLHESGDGYGITLEL